MFSNTTGINNTATGGAALGSNTTGAFNTATGRSTMFSNTTGILNTAHGYRALYTNTTGGANTANGFEALLSNTTGANNTGEGFSALFSNTTGHGNIALGFRAGINLTTGSRNIDIGNEGVAGESGKIRIGTSGEQKNAFIAGISGTTVPGGVAVIIGTDGHPNSIPQFGLVAEQVEKVNPGLVARDEEGKPYTVRYEAVNAMLLNEFLKEHRTVQEQKATIAQLKKDFRELGQPH